MNRTMLAMLGLAIGQLALGADHKAAATLHLEKIECSACAAAVRSARRDVPGVTAVDVDVSKKEVVVTFDPVKARPADLAEATAKRGFPAIVGGTSEAGPDRP